MPPRWVSAAIILGWIASVAWLFRWEIWPLLEPGAPPPYTIDLVDEAQNSKQRIRWRVTQNGRDTLVAHTYVVHRPKQNDFTLHAEFEERRAPMPVAHPRHEAGADNANKGKSPPYTIHHMTSAYRVNPDGQLLGLEIEMDFRMALLDFDVRIWGDVQDGKFAPHYEMTTPRPLNFSSPPVAVSSQGSVVMPLHPVNKIRGLKLGQQWRVPFFDPIADSIASLTPGHEGHARFLRAKVRPQVEILRWNGSDTRCLVIDYQEEDASEDDPITAETWVNEADAHVLKQAANLSGNQWVMIRDQ
jgi:hypothetical protein